MGEPTYCRINAVDDNDGHKRKSGHSKKKERGTKKGERSARPGSDRTNQEPQIEKKRVRRRNQTSS